MEVQAVTVQSDCRVGFLEEVSLMLASMLTGHLQQRDTSQDREGPGLVEWGWPPGEKGVRH
jgi:hypothetical protein